MVIPKGAKLIPGTPEGVACWINPQNGFKCVDLTFRADPRKRDPNWQAQAKKGMPSSEWSREFGETWVVYDGKAVYADFDDLHVVGGSIVVPRRPRLISGWDAGPNDVNLGWVLGLTSPVQKGVQFIDYYFAEDGDIEDFVQTVGTRLKLEWGRISGYQMHVADQSVFTKSSLVRGRAVVDVMRQHGMSPVPGEISFAKRRQSVEKLLVQFHRSVDNKPIPDLTVHDRCDLLVEAFKGGYCYGRTTVIGNQQWKETPMKNKFSHVMNALEYVCSKLELASLDVPYEGQRLPYVSVV